MTGSDKHYDTYFIGNHVRPVDMISFILLLAGRGGNPLDGPFLGWLTLPHHFPTTTTKPVVGNTCKRFQQKALSN